MQIFMKALAFLLVCFSTFVAAGSVGVLVLQPGQTEIPMATLVGGMISCIPVVLFGAMYLLGVRTLDQLKAPAALNMGPMPSIGDLVVATEEEGSSVYRMMALFSPVIIALGWWGFSIAGIGISVGQMTLGLLIAFLIGWLHEAIHVIALPGDLRKTAKIGFDLRMLNFFTVFSGRISRRRYGIVLLAPAMLLSVVPLGAALLVVPNSILAAYVVMHTAMCAGDMIIIAWMLVKVAPGGQVLQHGAQTAYSPK